MLGRKSYDNDEINAARRMVAQQLKAYAAVSAADGADQLEPVLFNTAAVALDRLFVHRVRTFTGKDTNPLSEVEMLAESLLDNDGVLREVSVVKYVPEKSVLGLKVGDRITLTADDFERLADAFLAEVEKRSD